MFIDEHLANSLEQQVPKALSESNIPSSHFPHSVYIKALMVRDDAVEYGVQTTLKISST